MVLIPAGEFDMGSPETERARNANESAHRVRIREPYWMATTETTQQAWEAVMGSNPSRAKGHAQQEGFAVQGLIKSPLLGPKGNAGFLAWLGNRNSDLDIPALVAAALRNTQS